MSSMPERQSGASRRQPSTAALRRRESCAVCRHPRSFHTPRCRALGCRHRCPTWSPALPSAPAARTGDRGRLRHRLRPKISRETRLTPPRHIVAPHCSQAFRATTHGHGGWCSYLRFCGQRAVVDSFDWLGRRRALCPHHLSASPVFGFAGQPRAWDPSDWSDGAGRGER